MSREDRDLLVRWIRDMRREWLPPHSRRLHEQILRRLRALNPRTLRSVPSPRAPARAIA